MWQARKKETGPFLSNTGSKSRPQGTGNTSGVGTVQSCVILAEHLGNRTSLLRLFARYPDSCWALASCCSSATVHRKRSTRLLQRAMWFGLERVSTGLHHYFLKVRFWVHFVVLPAECSFSVCPLSAPSFALSQRAFCPLYTSVSQATANLGTSGGDGVSSRTLSLSKSSILVQKLENDFSTTEHKYIFLLLPNCCSQQWVSYSNYRRIHERKQEIFISYITMVAILSFLKGTITKNLNQNEKLIP